MLNKQNMKDKCINEIKQKSILNGQKHFRFDGRQKSYCFDKSQSWNWVHETEMSRRMYHVYGAMNHGTHPFGAHVQLTDDNCGFPVRFQLSSWIMTPYERLKLNKPAHILYSKSIRMIRVKLQVDEWQRSLNNVWVI